MGLGEYDDDERTRGRKKVFREFDCPQCDANNPYDDGFGHGDEVRCFYCGTAFRVRVTSDNRLKLRDF